MYEKGTYISTIGRHVGFRPVGLVVPGIFYKHKIGRRVGGGSKGRIQIAKSPAPVGLVVCGISFVCDNFEKS